MPPLWARCAPLCQGAVSLAGLSESTRRSPNATTHNHLTHTHTHITHTHSPTHVPRKAHTLTHTCECVYQKRDKLHTHTQHQHTYVHIPQKHSFSYPHKRTKRQAHGSLFLNLIPPSQTPTHTHTLTHTHTDTHAHKHTAGLVSV